MRNLLFTILKFIGFILIIPVVITTTLAFCEQLGAIPKGFQHFFLYGVIAYLIVYLFIVGMQGFHALGQSAIAAIFRFFPPLSAVVLFIIPTYTILFLAILYFVSSTISPVEVNHYLFFFASFSLAMHLILSAQSLRELDKSAVKPGYFFSLSLVYIINLVLVALLLSLNFKDYSISGFFGTMIDVAIQIYKSIFKQLFGL